MEGTTQQFTFDAESASVTRARHAVTGFAREHGVPAALLGGLALAVSEACTNVVLHAYRDEEAPGRFTVGLAVSDASLRVLVRDDGIGMRPRMDSPGLGLGLPIIATTADSFAVAPCESGGTELHMRFDLSAAA
jgi:anti-sigma regulatory factor (Ser/Thr protein kinase)